MATQLATLLLSPLQLCHQARGPCPAVGPFWGSGCRTTHPHQLCFSPRLSRGLVQDGEQRRAGKSLLGRQSGTAGSPELSVSL